MHEIYENIFEDWQAQRITSVLHEKKGGYAFNKDSIKALEKKAIAGGVSILKGITVNGFNKENNGIVKSVITDQGIIECDQVVIGAGPWVRDFWNMLGLPKKIEIKGKRSKITRNRNVEILVFTRGSVGG